MSIPNYVVEERDITGQTRQIHLGDNVLRSSPAGLKKPFYKAFYVKNLAKRMFLPAGYPDSVSPDYLRYQIMNALQAFCNSLAGLLSSRAILQGFGVGDPSATPTGALLLTVLQDVASRFTTIFAAHIFGSSLYPEAKTYRLLADVLNDMAVILDTLSPFFNSLPIPGLRISAMCLSSALKALCGICAGGSKAAITMHFANAQSGKGDIGDLNAKDASKETVLALLGMLLGTSVIPYVTTPFATYTALVSLVALHLLINYFGVRGLIMRSLNRQRLGIAWLLYRKSPTSTVPNPTVCATRERIFERFGTVRDLETRSTLGKCIIGSSFSDILRHPVPPVLLDLFNQEYYLIWFDSCCIQQERNPPRSIVLPRAPVIHICLKEGYKHLDLVKAWIHAVEICQSHGRRSDNMGTTTAMDEVKTAYETVHHRLAGFLAKSQSAGWDLLNGALMTGVPASTITNVATATKSMQDKKDR